MSRRPRRTKVVTALGPATDRDNNLERAIAAGTNIVRMNSSHGPSEDHKIRADKVHKIATKLGHHVATLGDLQGFKIHVSTFKEGRVLLNIGDKFLPDASLGEDRDDKERVGTDCRGLPVDAVPGDILSLDDGRVQLKAPGAQGMKVFTEVTVGGPLSSNKGISKFGDGLSAEVPIGKDKVDVKTAALTGVDYLAVSFPCCGEDLNYVCRLARDTRCDTKIVVKVRRTEAVCSREAMDDIILVSDVVMVTRGDLGVEIGDPELAGVQKASVRRAHQPNRAIIATTQMMESMIVNPMSARAGVMGIANAVLDSTDTVMLSAKTATGQRLLETVAAMARACLGAEKTPNIDVSRHRLDVQFDNVEEAIIMSAMYVANHLKGVTMIITMTESGRTTLMTSYISPGLLIFAMSCHERTLNLTALYRGATPVHFDSANDGVAAASETVNLLHGKDYLISDDLMIVAQGDMMSTMGSTNITRILAVG